MQNVVPVLQYALIIAISGTPFGNFKHLPYSTLRRRAKLTVQSWSNVNEETADEVLPIMTSTLSAHYSECSTYEADPVCNVEAAESDFEKYVGITKISNTNSTKEPMHQICTPSYNYDEEDGKYVGDLLESEEDSDEHGQALEVKLSKWYVEEKVTGSAVDSLLKLLHPYHPTLPLTARTLISTGQHTFAIQNVAGGEYVHFGIMNSLRRYESKLLNLDDKSLNLHINVDGLPLFRSSSTQLWPILGLVVGIQKPFIIGAFCGRSKPSDVNSFLSNFVNEAIALHDQGFMINDVQFQVQVSCFICDAPARSFLKQTKSHTGYHACERCCQKGEYVDNRMTFPSVNSEKRMDDKFANFEYPEHQVNRSCLTQLNLGLVSCFVLDYMHLVCLGIVRRMLFLWIKGPLKYRISAVTVSLISQKLVAIRGHTPVEFVRKPRSLSELEHWKASELRQFVLYTGSVVLKSQLKSKFYEHFVCLSVIMHLLLSPTACQYYCDYAEKLLLLWVERSQQLYGKHFAVYNVHSIIHLPDDVRNFGNLDSVSAFPFENFMRHLKSSIRRPQKILQQLANRVSEGYFDACYSDQQQYGTKKQHASGPVVAGLVHCKQYCELHLEEFCLKTSFGDNCIAFDNKIALVANICNDGTVISLIVQRFKVMKKFFRHPLSSTDLGIYKLSKLSKRFEICPVSQIRSKYVLLPHTKDKWIGIPLLHLA